MDSQSMFLSASEPGGATLLNADLNGDAQTIWQQPQSAWVWGISSPDEHHLAIMGSTSESNAWTISNF
jgi:hypothetical protein